MENLEKLARLVRYYCLLSTTTAGSGHLTSSLSAVDIMTTLFFGGFLKFDPKNPDNPANDRIIFSKGHASPLFYSLWTVAGVITEDELLTYRKFGSRLEGHPSMEFPLTEAPTGSLGQGLSIGLGMALAGRLKNYMNKVYVLMGDGETAEGSVWEAVQLAAHYKLGNLIGIIDVNRLGQTKETMLGWDLKEYKRRIESFGWEGVLIDGHNFHEISHAFSQVHNARTPTMIIAKTIKGKGISFLENEDNFHGKALPQEEIGEAKKSLGEIDLGLTGSIAKPENKKYENNNFSGRKSPYVAQSRFYNVNSDVAESQVGNLISTRRAYGEALASLASEYPSLVCLDGEVSNSTYSKIFAEKYPGRFFEMYIAEQNMVGVAVGFSKRGFLPFVSTFSAFWSRAHDQVRMAGYALSDIKFVGSHAGVSIGEDGQSQMGLEDIAMFRSIFGSTVLYPSDAVSTKKLVELAAKKPGIVYLRTTRMETPVIYHGDEEFKIGGSKIVKSTRKDEVTVIGAGVTLHEALKAYEELKRDNIKIRVIDLYSIKPVDSATLTRAAEETKAIIVAEDHYPEGGIVDAVRSSLKNSKTPVYSLSVTKMPRSGKPQELLAYEEIDAGAIVNRVRELLR